MIISKILLVICVLTCYYDIIKQLKKQNDALNTISKLMSENYLAQGCFFDYATDKLIFNSLTAQWILVCLKPSIEILQEEALEDDDYELASHCNDILNAINRLIKYPPNA